MELVYDPNILKVYDIKPATFITNPEVLQKNIDEENGRISFWLKVSKNQSWVEGEGTIATISFAKIGSGSAEILFSPKTSVSANGIKDSVLKEAFPGFINEVPSPTPFPTRINIPTPTLETP